MTNAVIYAYQASPEVNGLEKQIENCKKYCLDNSLTIVAIYQEEAGKRNARARLLENAKTGEFQVVVVHDLSRFSRNATEFVFITSQLQESGIAIQNCTGSKKLDTKMRDFSQAIADRPVVSAIAVQTQRE